MSIFGGGGGGGSAPAPTQPATTTQYIREAPGIEERKLGLMDIASSLAQTPINLPAIQVSPASALEQQGITASGTTGVGAPTTTAGVGSALTALQGPNINQFLNPYQNYVVDEINRQAQIAQNRLGAQAVGVGAFGGGREGVAQAEIERARLANVGQAMATGFGQAANLATAQQQLGLQGASQLGALGRQQQGMAQADINQLMAAGGLQRQLGQQALDATRQTELQRAYEPFQRAEFLKNIYAAGPTTQSAVTSTTAPSSAGNPLAQAAGAGLGAYATYSMLNRQPAAAGTALSYAR
tara:strand:- start:5813 stop:6703 length:891 start_codon:yes stop_codon:yes gene_type:complete